MASTSSASYDDHGLAAEWENLNADSPGGSVFTSEIWLNAFRGLPRHTIRLVLHREDGRLTCGVPLLIREKGHFRSALPPAATPYFGFVFSASASKSSREAVGETVRVLGGKILRLVHYAEIPNLPGVDLDPPAAWAVERRLTFRANPNAIGPEDTLPKGVRYEIRKARRRGIKAEIRNEPEEFFELLAGMCAAKGIDLPLPRRVFLALAARLQDRNRAMIYLARRGTINAAGAVIVSDAHRSYYWLAATRPEFRGSGASYLLLNEVLIDLHNGKRNELDLVGANVPSVAKFKEHFASGGEAYSVLKGFSSKFAKIGRKTYQWVRGGGTP